MKKPMLTAIPSNHMTFVHWILGVLLVMYFAEFPARAAEKRFHVTVRDDTGAVLDDIAVGVRARGQAAAAVTDAAGLAQVTLDVNEPITLAVVWVDSFSLLAVDDSERSRLAGRALGMLKIRPIERLVRVTADVDDYNVELLYRGFAEFIGVITEQGGPPSQLWNVNPPKTYWDDKIQVDGSFRIPGPTNSDVLFEVYGDDTNAPVPGRSIIVRVPAAAIGPDGDLGTIDINPIVGPTGNVRFNFASGPEQFRQAHALFEASAWGLTLVKSDGRTVMSFFADSDLHIANDPAVMPVGTWYVVPGSYFCWTWTQRRIVEACLDGVDLSTSGIPSITVTEGANMEVNIDPVAAELAIQNFFTPPP